MNTEKKKIIINIGGLSAVGKSTIMEKIYRMLWIDGFDVELNLESNFDYSSEIDFRRKMAINNVERQEAVKRKSKIILSEVRMVHDVVKGKDVMKDNHYEGQD